MLISSMKFHAIHQKHRMQVTPQTLPTQTNTATSLWLLYSRLSNIIWGGSPFNNINLIHSCNNLVIFLVLTFHFMITISKPFSFFLSVSNFLNHLSKVNESEIAVSYTIFSSSLLIQNWTKKQLKLWSIWFSSWK